MAVIETIAPIFFIIVFGYLLQQKGLLKAQFIQEANRFVFLFSLPVLIFTGIMKSDIKDIDLINILSVIIPTLVILCLAFILALAMGLEEGDPRQLCSNNLSREYYLYRPCCPLLHAR